MSVPTPTSAPASCLYEGAIRHRRHEVRPTVFRHRIALAYLDLDELPGLLGGRLQRRGPGLQRLRRRDLLGDPRRSVAEAVVAEVERQGGDTPRGPIRVLTALRSFGHCFNPVSFYLCFDASGERLEHVLAEVTNTPWGERRTYLVSGDAGRGEVLTGMADKALHVSPFMDMDQRYAWRVSHPDGRFLIEIENRRGEAVTFDATLSLRRRELTRASLARLSARYPAATLRGLALIYGHALGLRLRGVPVHSHPRERTA